ncbi:MAG: hypothetical protein AB7L92_00960 [Alphaproteobacteria bacterium]
MASITQTQANELLAAVISGTGSSDGRGAYKSVRMDDFIRIVGATRPDPARLYVDHMDFCRGFHASVDDTNPKEVKTIEVYTRRLEDVAQGREIPASPATVR